MARIAGVDIPRHKRIEIALTYIYGIGPAIAKRVVKDAGIDGKVRTQELTEAEVARIRSVIEANVKVEGDLRKEVSMNIKRLIVNATVAPATSAVCPFVASAPTPTRAPARVLAAPSAVAERVGDNHGWTSSFPGCRVKKNILPGSFTSRRLSTTPSSPSPIPTATPSRGRAAA